MRVLIFFLLMSMGIIASAQEAEEKITMQIDKEKLPVPNEKDQLFYLQRDPDVNTIVYCLNLIDGELDDKNPVQAYWVRFAENGQRMKLSFIQRRMAYGINHTKIEPKVYELHVQAYKPLKIILAQHAENGKYQAMVKVKDDQIILDRIFARIQGGSIFKPHVDYIEISGRSSKTGKKTTHRFEVQ